MSSNFEECSTSPSKDRGHDGYLRAQRIQNVGSSRKRNVSAELPLSLAGITRACQAPPRGVALPSGCHPRNPPFVSYDRTRHLAFIPVSCRWTLALLRSIDLFIFLTRQIGQTRSFRVPCCVRAASGASPVPSE